jgi:DNA primase
MPEDIFQPAEALARRLGWPRSRLYSAALCEYLARHAPEAVTAALDQVYREAEEPVDAALTAAARAVFRRSAW